MSDIYLELKSRIPVVAAKTSIGSDRLQQLQDAKGLSNERIARLIPVSEKTWRRWKEAGEIPTAALPAVAPILGLEIHGTNPEPLLLEQPTSQDVLERVAGLEASVESLRRVVLDALDALGDQRAAR